MKNILSLCILPLVGCLSAVEVPNTFVDGEPAYASEVNENFETLETAIEANTTAQTALAGRVTNVENAGSGGGSGTPTIYEPFASKQEAWNLSYVKNVQSIGSTIVVGGSNYIIGKFAIADPVNGKTYHIVMPMLKKQNDTIFAHFTILKSSNTLTSTLQIDGYDALALKGNQSNITFSESSAGIKSLENTNYNLSSQSIYLKINGIVLYVTVYTELNYKNTVTPTDYDFTDDGLTKPTYAGREGNLDDLIDLITITEQP